MSTSSSAITFSQIDRFYRRLKEKGVDSRIFQEQFLESGIFSDLAEAVVFGDIPDRDQFRRFLGFEPLKLCFEVVYGMSIEALASFAECELQKNVNWGRFPWSTRRGARRVVGELVRGQDLLVKKAQNFLPASVEELLALARAYPDLQRRFPVIGLGSESVIRGNRHVVEISTYQPFSRHLRERRMIYATPMPDAGYGWSDQAFFLVIRDARPNEQITE